MRERSRRQIETKHSEVTEDPRFGKEEIEKGKEYLQKMTRGVRKRMEKTKTHDSPEEPK